MNNELLVFLGYLFLIQVFIVLTFIAVSFINGIISKRMTKSMYKDLLKTESKLIKEGKLAVKTEEKTYEPNESVDPNRYNRPLNVLSEDEKNQTISSMNERVSSYLNHQKRLKEDNDKIIETSIKDETK